MDADRRREAQAKTRHRASGNLPGEVSSFEENEMAYFLQLLLIYHGDGAIAKSMLWHNITLVMTMTLV